PTRRSSDLIGFLNDDYVFLDAARNGSIAAAFDPRSPHFLWYRPWSRDLYYMVVQRIFGPSTVAFHALSLALLLGIAIGYGRIAHALVGRAAARFTVAGWLAMMAWAVPLLWVAGVQDLWMLFAAMLYLDVARRDGSRVLGAVLLVIALLSKETAAVLPFLGAVFRINVGRRRARNVLLHAWPEAIILGVWALIHPRIGKLFGGATGATSASALPRMDSVTQSLGSLINADALTTGLRLSPLALLVGAGLGLILAAWVFFAKDPPPRPDARAAVLRTCSAWALLGWMPAFASGADWHSYYGLLGAAGAWLLIAVLVRPRAIRATLIFAVAVLGLVGLNVPS